VIFSRICCDRTRGNGLNLKEVENGYKDKVFYSMGYEALEQIVQRGGECFILEDSQGLDGALST